MLDALLLIMFVLSTVVFALSTFVFAPNDTDTKADQASVLVLWSIYMLLTVIVVKLLLAKQ